MFHWIFLGLLLALIIFLLVGKVGFIEPEVKGQWPIDFLTRNYLEAEKDLLKTDIIAKNIGINILAELTSNGGFKESKKSDCGQVNNINLWNKPDRLCFPEVMKNVQELAGEKLKAEMPQNSFTEIGFTENTFWGKGNQQEIVSDQAKYIYDANFAINLGYSINEFNLVKVDAVKLLRKCSDIADLKQCLDNNKLTNWKYTSCDAEAFPQNTKQISFCVESPNQAILPKKVGLAVAWEPVRYRFALDFTLIPAALQ